MTRDVGFDILQAGLSFAGVMRGQKRDAMVSEAVEREKRVKSAAYSMFKDPEFDMGDAPLDEKFDASREAAIIKSDTMRKDIDYEKQKAIKRSALRQEYLDGIQKAELAINSGDVRTAGKIVAGVSKYAPTGWNAEFREDDKGNEILYGTNSFTGETKEIPVTKDGLTPIIEQGKKWRDTEDYDTAAKSADNERRKLNEELTKKREVLFDPDTKRPIGLRHEVLIPSDDGSFAVQRRWVYLDQNLQTVSPDAFKGAVPESQIKGEAEYSKAEADKATSQFQAKRARLAGQNLTTPEWEKTFRTQGGQYLAPNAVGGYVPVSASMAKQEKPHFIGGTFTDEGGNVQALAQTDPYSTRLTKVNTGVKVVPKEGSQVSVQDPDTGKQILIPKGQAKQLDNQLKMAKELLADVKDDKGNSLSLLLEEPSDMNPKKGEMLVDKLNRIIQDPKASKEAKYAAGSAKFVYQAYGVMPLDRKGTTGKGGTAKQEAPPSAFKEGWNLYGSLKGYPDKQKALLEAWRNSGDPGLKKVVEQIESIRKKIPKTE